MAIVAPVSSSFCVPHETNLVVKHKPMSGSTEFSVEDENGVLVFTMKSDSHLASRAKRRISDAASGEVLLLIKKERKWFGPSSWMAFHGDSESESDLLFTMSKGSFSASYKVFLLGNDDSSNPDFYITRNSSSSSSFDILSRGTPVAQAERIGWARSGYNITVYPDVDRAFIAALAIVWIERIYKIVIARA